QNERARADKCVRFDRDLRYGQRHSWLAEVVAAGAEVNLLRDSGTLADFNFAQGICVGAIAETRAIAQGEMPRNSDTRPRMNKGRAIDFRVENAQPKESPWIERLRRPLAENEPGKFPQHAQNALAPIPRGFERDRLI